MEPVPRALRRRAPRAAWVLAAGAALLAGCGPSPRPEVPGRTAPLVPPVVRVGRADGSGPIREMPIEQYVLATILSEIAPAGRDRDAAERLFEVQAIVTRTYAAANLGRHAAQGFDLCDSTHCQVIDRARLADARWLSVAKEAVDRTAGMALLYNGRAAQTLFHADCGGHTSGADDVWGGAPVPYLTGRPDALPGNVQHLTWRYEITASRLANAVAQNGGPSTGTPPTRVDVIARDRAGRAVRVTLTGTRTVTLRGEDFRTALNQVFGPQAIRSTWFTVSRSGTRFVFEGRGFGHGVGLCQAGAAARARAGDRARDILAFYYPGTVLTRGARARVAPVSPTLRPRGAGQAP